MNTKIIEKDSEVLAHFSIELMDGSVADSTRVNRKPMLLLLGRGELSQAFEAELLGLPQGARKEFVLEAKDAFGYPNPANFHWVPRSQFPEALAMRIGLIVEFEQINGAKLPGIIRALNDTEATIDFNHPLCGQTLKFKIEILSIAPHDPEDRALF